MLKAFWMAMSHSRLSPAKKAVKAFWLLWELAFNPRVSTDLYRRRQERCEVCPIYNRKMQTCGTAGEVLADKQHAFGCWCYMPVKARLATDCWLWERNLTMGWPDELNSSYIDREPENPWPRA